MPVVTIRFVIPLPTDDELMPANREKLKLANDLNVAKNRFHAARPATTP
jgi:hypothetical protein